MQRTFSFQKSANCGMKNTLLGKIATLVAFCGKFGTIWRKRIKFCLSRNWKISCKKLDLHLIIVVYTWNMGGKWKKNKMCQKWHNGPFIPEITYKLRKQTLQTMEFFEQLLKPKWVFIPKIYLAVLFSACLKVFPLVTSWKIICYWKEW